MRALFRPEILQAGAVKGLMSNTVSVDVKHHRDHEKRRDDTHSFRVDPASFNRAPLHSTVSQVESQTASSSLRQAESRFGLVVKR